MRKLFIPALLTLCSTTPALAQAGKTIDTAQQKERIKKMPMDTSGQQPGKYKNPAQGGEHSGKNIDNQKKPVKQGSPKKERTGK